MRSCLSRFVPGLGRRLAAFGVLGTALAYLALAAPSACTTQPDPPNDVISFCEAAAQAQCQVASACSVDQVTCQQYQNAQCSLQAQIATHAATRHYDPNAGQACIQELQVAFAYTGGVATVAFTVPFHQLEAMSNICERAYAGLVPQGDSCSIDYDCAAGLSCTAKSPGGDPAVCEAAQSVMAGQSCSGLGAQCAAGSYCSDQSGQWQCAPGADVGQPCAAGVYCLGNQHCVNHICPTPGTAGASCVTDGDCGSNAPYCDPFTNTCAQGLTFQPGSADCMGLTGVMTTAGPDASAGDDGGPSGQGEN
jgi:hypothetical protein